LIEPVARLSRGRFAHPLSQLHAKRRSLDDYDLEKQLYRGKASLLYSATCRQSGLRVVLKLYRKHKLSELNWYQVRPCARRWLQQTCFHHGHP